MTTSSLDDIDRHIWWRRPKPYSRIEILCDIVVHCLGIVVAILAGGTLLTVAAFRTAPEQSPAIAIYVGSLLALFLASLAFNIAPIAPIKRFLARLDQAAIFLLIAGTYTPVLAMLSGTPIGPMMLTVVWGGSLIGIALKLIVPQHFGRLALVLYAGIGWSGIAVFNSLAQALPPSTLWLLLAGGVAYSSGIVFHVWEKLNFHNVVWHCFVVLGASLHLWAILDCMVLRRL
jgi:hemolysin III